MAWETDNALYGRTNSPWGARSDAWRIEWRRGRGDCGGAVGGRRRQRRRRIDPRAGALQRHLRPQAHAWPRACHRTLPAVRRSLRAHRCRRPDGAHHRRRAAAARGDGGRRHRRSRMGIRCHSELASCRLRALRIAAWASSKTTGSCPWMRTRGGRSGKRCGGSKTRELQWSPSGRDGLEQARELWWEIFGRASRLLLEPLVAGRESEVHPNLVEFLDWTRRDPPLTALGLLRSRDRARHAEDAGAAADGALSGAALPRRPDARLPARRARVDDRGHARPLPRRVALYGVVQPAAESGGVGARHLVGRGPAHRRAGRRTAVGGADRAGRRARDRAGAWPMDGATCTRHSSSFVLRPSSSVLRP